MGGWILWDEKFSFLQGLCWFAAEVQGVSSHGVSTSRGMRAVLFIRMRNIVPLDSHICGVGWTLVGWKPSVTWFFTQDQNLQGQSQASAFH